MISIMAGKCYTSKNMPVSIIVHQSPKGYFGVTVNLQSKNT